MRERIILALVSATLAGAPVAAAESRAGPILTGPIEQLPQSWGAPPAGPPVPAPAAQAAPAPAPVAASIPATTSVAPAAPPSPRAADQVGALVVQARRSAPAEQTVEKCVTGPAWWRVSNAAATLWIMVTPDRMPMATPFDDTCLRKRLAAARVAIVPAMPSSGASDPFGRGQTPLRAAEAPLDQRLPAALWTQLSRRIDNNPVRSKADLDWALHALVQDLPPGIVRGMVPSSQNGGARWDYYTLYRIKPRTTLQMIRDTPNLFAPPIVVAQRLSQAFDAPGRMGNPAADRVAKLAGAANMLIARTQNSAAQFSDLTYLSNPAQADQEACLKGVLDELDAGHTGLGSLDKVQAWAVGDVENGLRRMNPISACAFGDLSVRFWSTIVAQEMELIDRAMKAGGVAVAVVEYDPLFMRGGVMERLKAEGYRIETPEELR